MPILLNLLNSLRKTDKMLGKPRILSLYRNLFIKFNKPWVLLSDTLFISTNVHLLKKLEENVLTILSESVALTVTAVDFKAVVSGIVTLYNKLSNSGI